MFFWKRNFLLVFTFLLPALAVGQDWVADSSACDSFHVLASASTFPCGYQVSCFGANDGSIQLNVSGGTEPLFFSWGREDTASYLLNVSAGYYKVTVRDSRGCVTGDSIQISQPDPFIATACNDQTVTRGYPPYETASLNAEASGGCLPYSFFWEGELPASLVKVHPDTTTLFVIQVLDANGCLATDSLLVTVVDVRCGPGNDKVLMCGNGNLKYVEMENVYQELQIGSTIGPCDPYLSFDGGDCGEPAFLCCDCLNGIRELCLKFEGINEPDIEFMEDSTGKVILTTYLSVKSGELICVNSNVIQEKANTILPPITWLRINGETLYKFETECNTIRCGSTIGPFTINGFIDGRDAICREGVEER